MVSTSMSVTCLQMVKGLADIRSVESGRIYNAKSINFRSTPSQGNSGQVKEMYKETIKESRYVLNLDLIPILGSTHICI